MMITTALFPLQSEKPVGSSMFPPTQYNTQLVTGESLVLIPPTWNTDLKEALKESASGPDARLIHSWVIGK